MQLAYIGQGLRKVSMESTEYYRTRLATLQLAVQGFLQALQVDAHSFEQSLGDVIKCGHVQKFEYCSELLWKTIKLWLVEQEVEEVNSPKAVIKAFYQVANISDDLYKRLLEVIHDRNLYSHVYNQQEFEKLYQKLPEHAAAIQETLLILKKSVP